VSSVAYLIQHLFELVVSPLCSRIRNIVAEHSERSPPPLPLPRLNKTKRGRVQVKFGPDSRHRGPVRNYPAVPVLGDLGRYLSSIYHTFSTTLRLLQLNNHTVDVPFIAAPTSPSIDTKPSTSRHRSGGQGKRVLSKICGLRGWVAARLEDYRPET
jgi:hypothetical protein